MVLRIRDDEFIYLTYVIDMSQNRVLCSSNISFTAYEKPQEDVADVRKTFDQGLLGTVAGKTGCA